MASFSNSKVRFAYDANSNKLLDYKTGKALSIAGTYNDGTITWDLERVKQLILSGKSVEDAIVAIGKLPAPTPSAPAPTAAQPEAPAPNVPVVHVTGAGAVPQHKHAWP